MITVQTILCLGLFVLRRLFAELRRLGFWAIHMSNTRVRIQFAVPGVDVALAACRLCGAQRFHDHTFSDNIVLQVILALNVVIGYGCADFTLRHQRIG